MRLAAFEADLGWVVRELFGKPLSHLGFAHLGIAHADGRPEEPLRIALHHLEHDLYRRVGLVERHVLGSLPGSDSGKASNQNDGIDQLRSRGDDAERDRAVAERHGDDRMARFLDDSGHVLGIGRHVIRTRSG